MKICPFCRAENEEDAVQCWSCKKVPDPDPAPAPVQPEEEVPNPCPACGYDNDDDARFCGKCGIPVAPREPAAGGTPPQKAAEPDPGDKPAAPTWRCGSCGERLEAAFDTCWKCGTARGAARFGQSALIDVNKLVDDNSEKWVNLNLTEVNDCIVRLGIFEGEFHWHKHDIEDELFYVLSGKLLLDLQDRTVELLPNQGYTVPCTVVHRTRAQEKTVVLMVEKSTVRPEGDGEERSAG